MLSGEQKIIVVLGMHRSGTSAITRALPVMGVDVGNNLLMPGECNEKGFWEDIDVLSLNVEMLNAIRNDWCHLSVVEESDVDTLCEGGYLYRASELLKRKLENTSLFGVKDPRMAKLIAFWSRVFKHCRVNAQYLLAVRNPLSVVRSLEKRDGFMAERSYLLWLGHVISSLSGSAGQRRILVDYDRLMSSPLLELKRIAKHFGLKVDLTEGQIYAKDFIDNKLRHSTYDLEDLNSDESCPRIVQEIYAALLDVASGRMEFDCIEMSRNISKWSNEYDRLKVLLSLIDRLNDSGLMTPRRIRGLC